MGSYSGTKGNNRIAGSDGGDLIDFSQGGRDTVAGAGGDDTLLAGGALDGADKVSGGAGLDRLVLDGDYSGGLSLSPGVVNGVEDIRLAGGHAYALSFADGDYGLQSAALTVEADPANATAAMQIDASAVTATAFSLIGGSADDRLTGGGGGDTLTPGAGDDTVAGGAGNDIINLDGNLSTADRIDGGAGSDNLGLTVSGRTILSGYNIQNVEQIYLTFPTTERVILADSLATPGLENGFLRVVVAGAHSPGAMIDGSAERDTQLQLFGNGGADTLIGGDGNDDLLPGDASPWSSDGGRDHLSGRGGDDVFSFASATLTSADRIDGGGGHDTVALGYSYGYPAAVKLGPSTLVSVEAITLADNYALVLNDGNVAAGKSLVVDASFFGGDASQLRGVSIDGSDEADGRLSLQGGAGADKLTGGAAADTLAGAAGPDTLTGGAGGDHFVFASLDDSPRNAGDLITDLGDDDVIMLGQIDAKSDVAGNQAFTLVAEFTHVSGQAMLKFNAATDMTTLSLDVDGDGQSDADIRLQGNHTGFTHFVL